jgi:hypothetical protein
MFIYIIEIFCYLFTCINKLYIIYIYIYIWEEKYKAFLKYHYYGRSYNPFLKIWNYCKYYVHIVFNPLIS